VPSAGAGEPVSSPAESPSPAGGAGPPGPQAWGFDIDAMNERWAFVLVGDKARIYMQENAAAQAHDMRFLMLDAFHAKFQNTGTQVIGASGNIKTMTWSKRWLEHPQRRSYDGVEFWPNPDGAPATPRYLNLWSGFSVEPAAGGRQRYATFHDHLLNNVCNGHEDLFRWVFAFFAHIVQRPRERVGVALVLRGGQGVGKTKVGEVFGSLLGSHYFLIDDKRYLVGHFNAHQGACLLLQADEAVWAGDREAEGRLRGLITAPTQMVEHKGVNAIKLRNYVRVVMTGNEPWLVPAGKDERRFGVLDVNKRCQKNHAYFAEIDAELDNGGRAALLADLLAFDLSTARLREIPRTKALVEQKIRSFPDIDAWWHERLDSGSITRNSAGWPSTVVTEDLYADFVAWMERRGIRRKPSPTEFGMAMRKYLLFDSMGERRVPDPHRRLGSETGRKWGYDLAELCEARMVFCRICEVSTDDMGWDRSDAEEKEDAETHPDTEVTW
jgi:hypothetical protein